MTLNNQPEANMTEVEKTKELRERLKLEREARYRNLSFWQRVRARLDDAVPLRVRLVWFALLGRPIMHNMTVTNGIIMVRSNTLISGCLIRHD